MIVSKKIDHDVFHPPPRSLLSSEWWTDSPDKPVKIRFADSGPGAEQPLTVVSLFNEIVGKHGEHTALAVKRAGEWKSWSYRKYYVDCFTAAKAMIEVCVCVCVCMCVCVCACVHACVCVCVFVFVFVFV